MDRIYQLHGMDEFKAMCGRLEVLAANRRRLPGCRLPLPCFLFAETPGSGMTTHLQMLAELMEELELISFQGERMVVEHRLDDSIQPLLKAIQVAAGCHHSFRGVVGIELDPGRHEPSSRMMDQLIHLARDRQDEISFVFTMELSRDEQAWRKTVKQLTLALPMEVIRFPRLSSEDMCYYASTFLKQQGFELTEEAGRRLKETMTAMENAPEFDGMTSLHTMMNALIYHACAREKLKTPQINLAMMNDFLKSGYLNQISSIMLRGHRQIGFGGKEIAE